MIVLRVSPGLANQMYEFAAGYALARVRNEALALDISSCLGSAWGFQLDHFCIPDVEKILYVMSDPTDASHASATNIPLTLLAEGRAYSDDNLDLPMYVGLEDAAALEGNPILLCGYFFAPRYYAPFWEELRAMFTPRQHNSVLAGFARLAEGYDSVGIHIRRGDFLVTDWAFKPEDNFFRAAVAWYRKKLVRPRFFIFSDDIEYAKHILGMDSSFFYVHPLGHAEGPFSEFLCLSQCQHKVLSNDSTFSRLAYELNADPRKTALRRENDVRCSWGARLKKAVGKWLQRADEKVFFMDAAKVARWADRFAVDGKNAVGHYDEMVRKAVSCTDDAAALDTIDCLFLNVVAMSAGDRTALAWRKLVACARLGRNDEALDIAHEQWFALDDSCEFHRQYADVLLAAGYEEEAAVEAVRCAALVDDGQLTFASCIREDISFLDCCGKHRFLVVPSIQMQASSRPQGLVSLGIVLRRLGHEVTLLLKTGSGQNEDKGESFYIRNNGLLMTRTGVCLGCGQLRYEDVLHQTDAVAFLMAFSLSSPVVVVTDSEKWRDAALGIGLRVVFAGSSGQEQLQAAQSDIIREANLLFSPQPSDLGGYTVERKRWSVGREQRLAPSEIRRAASICSWLSTASVER